MNHNAHSLLRKFCTLGITIAVTFMPSWQYAWGAVTLPDETFSSPNQLQAVLLDIRQQSYDSAIDRMQTLLDKHAAELTRTDDGGLTAVDEFFAQLPAADRTAMQSPYDVKFGADADQLLARLEAAPDYRPQDLYAVTKRYPLSHAASVALAAAGHRAVDQGDLSSARIFYSLAAQHGWHGDAADDARIAAIAAPAESTDGTFGNAGPLPFDAPWFNLPSGFESEKIFPVGSGDLAFIAGTHAVLAFKPEGIVAWRWQPPAHVDMHKSIFRTGITSRGRQSVPAMLCDSHRLAKIVVVCQNVPSDHGGYLVGLRASDGRLLWSTESDPALASVAFLGSPSVAGRYVIAVGLQPVPDDANAGTLELIAVDVTSGHLLWRALLANVSVSTDTAELDLYHDQSCPTIVEDCVLVAPNIGGVFTIDRFDGQIRWVRPYHRASIGDGSIRKFVDQRNKGRDLIAPLAWTDLLRWDCTPRVFGNVVITAPQDTTAIIALDRSTGKTVWESGNLPQATPVGFAAGKLILSGADITAVDPATGLKAWTFTPIQGIRLTGPAVVRDENILVRSTAGLLEVSPADGTSTASQATTDFHPVAASDAGKAALAGNGIVGAFGVPAPGRGGR